MGRAAVDYLYRLCASIPHSLAITRVPFGNVLEKARISEVGLFVAGLAAAGATVTYQALQRSQQDEQKRHEEFREWTKRLMDDGSSFLVWTGIAIQADTTGYSRHAIELARGWTHNYMTAFCPKEGCEESWIPSQDRPSKCLWHPVASEWGHAPWGCVLSLMSADASALTLDLASIHGWLGRSEAEGKDQNRLLPSAAFARCRRDFNFGVITCSQHQTVDLGGLKLDPEVKLALVVRGKEGMVILPREIGPGSELHVWLDEGKLDWRWPQVFGKVIVSVGDKSELTIMGPHIGGGAGFCVKPSKAQEPTTRIALSIQAALVKEGGKLILSGFTKLTDSTFALTKVEVQGNQVVEVDGHEVSAGVELAKALKLQGTCSVKLEQSESMKCALGLPRRISLTKGSDVAMALRARSEQLLPEFYNPGGRLELTCVVIGTGLASDAGGHSHNVDRLRLVLSEHATRGCKIDIKVRADCDVCSSLATAGGGAHLNVKEVHIRTMKGEYPNRSMGEHDSIEGSVKSQAVNGQVAWQLSVHSTMKAQDIDRLFVRGTNELARRL